MRVGEHTWRVHLRPRLDAGLSRDGLAHVITAMPEPEEWPGWEVVESRLFGTLLVNRARLMRARP